MLIVQEVYLYEMYFCTMLPGSSSCCFGGLALSLQLPPGQKPDNVVLCQLLNFHNVNLNMRKNTAGSDFNVSSQRKAHCQGHHRYDLKKLEIKFALSMSRLSLKTISISGNLSDYASCVTAAKEAWKVVFWFPVFRLEK